MSKCQRKRHRPKMLLCKCHCHNSGQMNVREFEATGSDAAETMHQVFSPLLYIYATK